MALTPVNYREIVNYRYFVRQPFFENVIDRIFANIIDGDWDQ